MQTQENKYFIYMITNIFNDKKYIGKTINIEKRFIAHKKHAKNKVNRYLYDSMNKYGYDNFTISCIEEVLTNNIANERERYWISFYNSNNKEFGYNMTEGGDGGNTWDKNPHKEETSKKITLKNTGKKRTPEFCKQMSLLNKGRAVTEENKEQISRTLKEKYKAGILINTLPKTQSGKLHPMWGKTHTIEARTKMSKARTNKTYDELFDNETENKLREMHKKHFTENNPNKKDIDLILVDKLLVECYNIDEIAKKVGFSREGLHYKIKTIYGTTPNERRLLLKGELK